MPTLGHQLKLSRCPHCGVANPCLTTNTHLETVTHSGGNRRFWAIYICATCGGLVTAASGQKVGSVIEMYPTPKDVDVSIPEKAKGYLKQAIDSMHAPAGAVMLAASAVDAMLKKKGYKDGSLYDRINKAAEDHLITVDMAKWAHEVRLDANIQRHAKETAALPTEEDAKRSIDFAFSLAEFLFVLPGRVEKGLADATS
jgi:hypothetical protein